MKSNNVAHNHKTLISFLSHSREVVSYVLEAKFSSGIGKQITIPVSHLFNRDLLFLVPELKHKDKWIVAKRVAVRRDTEKYDYSLFCNTLAFCT